MSSRPIGSYALLSDCHSAALVGTDGSVDWLCQPRFDGPAVFARILDPHAGNWSIVPTSPYEVERRYLPGTLVLETTFTTAGGAVRLRDALAFPEGQRRHELGLDVPHELLRSVAGVEGTVELQLELSPRPEYGLVRPLLRATDDGARTFGGPNQVLLRAGVPVDVGENAVHARFELGAGDDAGFALRWIPTAQGLVPATDPADVAARIEDTAEGWRSWEADHDIYEGSHRELVRLSARVLKGLTYRPTARSLRRRRPLCPRPSAASATGTTATPGSAMRA